MYPMCIAVYTPFFTVMVSAGFCHLLADAERRLHSEGHFPLAPFLCALGFLLTLFADNVAHHLSAKHGLDHSECHGAGQTSQQASIPLAEIAVVGGSDTAHTSKPLGGGGMHGSANGTSPKLAKVEDATPCGVVDEALTTTAAAGISEAKPRPATRLIKGSDGYASLQQDGALGSICRC